MIKFESTNMSYQYKPNKRGACRMCQEPDEKDGYMVECSECDRWFHPSCVKLSRKPTKDENFLCPKCIAIGNEINRLQQAAQQATQQVSSGKGQDSTEALVERICQGQQKQLQELTKVLGRIHVKEETKDLDWTIFLKRQALMSLPKFGGNPKEWPNFYKAFYNNAGGIQQS